MIDVPEHRDDRWPRLELFCVFFLTVEASEKLVLQRRRSLELNLQAQFGRDQLHIFVGNCRVDIAHDPHAHQGFENLAGADAGGLAE